MEPISDIHILVRIALATLTGLMIGIERHYNGKIAGVRTYSTMALCVSLLSVLAVRFFNENSHFVMIAIVLGSAWVSSHISVTDNNGKPEFANMVALWATAAIAICIAYGHYILGAGSAFILLAVYLIKDFFEERQNK